MSGRDDHDVTAVVVTGGCASMFNPLQPTYQLKVPETRSAGPSLLIQRRFRSTSVDGATRSGGRAVGTTAPAVTKRRVMVWWGECLTHRSHRFPRVTLSLTTITLTMLFSLRKRRANRHDLLLRLHRHTLLATSSLHILYIYFLDFCTINHCRQCPPE